MAVQTADGRAVTIHKTLFGTPKGISFGFLPRYRVNRADIASVMLVADSTRASAVGKVGWGAAGAIALGPVGLLAGALAGGNHREMMAQITQHNGAVILVKGDAKSITSILALGSA